MSTRWVGWVALAFVAGGCGGISDEVDDTVATVIPVRGAAQIGETDAAVVARASAGDTITTSERGLSRVSLDQGPQLLLDAESSLALEDGATVTLGAGRLFAETQPGEQLEIRTEQGSLRASDTSLSARVEDGTTRVYVVRGEVSWTHGEERGIASSGAELTLGAEGAQRTAATLWQDWTGGLARPGPADASGPAGVGQLEARVPDEVGLARWPLVVRRLDVRVRIERDLAVTEVDQLFFNPASETVEGLYRIRVPEGAVLQRFSVDRDDRLVDGYVREKAQARAAYQAQVYRGSTDDPALLEWDAPGSYRARIYPIRPGETRRIVIRYAEWLRPPAGGTARLYRYPMGGGARSPHIQEFALSVDVAEAGAERVRAGMGATVEGGAVRIRRSDFRPRSDFWLELVGGEGEGQRAWTAPHEPPPRAPDAPTMPNEADERDYFYLPLVLPTSLAQGESTGTDLVILADVSAATDRSHLELGRSVVESLTAHLGPEDRIAIVSSDLTIRSVIEGEEAALVEATPEHLERLLDGLARVPAGGATDLGAALAAAAGLLDPERHGAVVYVGDGAPTVGELRADGLLERLGRLPTPMRLYAVAVGSDANLELLSAVTRGGGLALRIEERGEAADAALEILAHAGRPIAHGVEVDLGAGIENAFPRRPMDAVLGEVFPVVGRVRDGVPPSVTVTGTVDGQPFSETIAIDAQTTEETTDLRLRWAAERLRQLLLDGAGREEVAELGTRYGLITPFTSYYVPSRRELGQMGPQASRWLDQPLLRVGSHESTGDVIGRTIVTVALGPLAIAGCRSNDSEASPSSWGGGSFEPAPVVAAPEVAAQADMAEAEEQTEADGEGGDFERRAQAAGGAPMAPSPEPSDEAANAGAIGVLGALPSGSAAAADPSANFDRQASRRTENRYGIEGPEEALGEDPMAAIGELMGDQVDDDSGFGGLAMRGTGRGGGGTGEGTIGLGNLGTIGHGGGDGSGSGYGQGAGGMRGRRADAAQVRTGTAEVRGSLSSEVIRRVIRRHINEVRFCYEQGLQTKPNLAGRLGVSFVISPTGAVQTASVRESTLGDGQVESCVTQAVRRWTFPAPDGGGSVIVNYPFVFGDGSGGGEAVARGGAPETTIVLTQIVHTTDAAAHRRARCSDAADLLLDDRRALWGERLSHENGAAGWVRLYREAIDHCEAPSWRDRSAFLGLVLGRAGSVDGMIQVYRLMSDGSARVFLRGQILRRVRTAEDLRSVRGAFNLGSDVDWTLVEQILDRAPNDTAKIRALRRLTWQHPDSFDLKLRLLATLERTEHLDEAKRLADLMRADPLADPGVRTAIGEMFLRMGREEDARRVFSEIVEFAPLDELARRRLGDLYRAHGWYEDAYRQYQTLSEIRPDDTSVRLLLAQAAAGAGRVDEALRLERGIMQTAESGASEGVARTALLWSSVRFARLREAARRSNDTDRLEQLQRRMRRSGVLREAGQLRVTLVWSHPDAQIGLWAGFPGLSLSRPTDITPEFGLEAMHLEEQEDGIYRFEVRRAIDEDQLTEVTAQLVVVWNEGEAEEKVEIVDLTFDRGRSTYAWTINGRNLSETTPGGGR